MKKNQKKPTVRQPRFEDVPNGAFFCNSYNSICMKINDTLGVIIRPGKTSKARIGNRRQYAKQEPIKQIFKKMELS